MNAPKNDPTNNDNQSGSNSARFEQQILNTSSIGVLITRIADGTILYANKAITNLLGIADIDSVIGSPVPNFYWDAEDLKEILTRFRAEGSITNNEVRARRADDSMIWVSLSIQPFDFNGEQVLLSEIMDITERKQAENALQESQRLLQLVMDNIPQAVFWKDKELAFLGGNQAVAEDAGLDSPQYLVGKTDFDMPWKDRAELYHADDRQVLELGEAKLNYEEMQTSPTGKQTWLRTSKIPMRDIDGNIFAVLGMYEDITERKQAEEAVQTNRARFQGLVETLSDWIWEVDQNGNYTYISPRIKDLLGYQPEEVLGKTPFDLMPPEEAQRVAGVFGPLLSTQQPLVALENTNRHKDGRLVVFETSGVPFFSINGEFKGYRGTDRDITERKHLEHEIQESFERRGYQVQVSTEISQNIAAASKLSDLFDRVVTLTKERLGYYHTQLLRYDATQDAVVLINGYGETGAKMLAGGHKMPMGMGLIGTAAASGNIVMRPTLADDPDWQPNPLLPETKGEIAVPIKLGEQILGVLDVQSSQAGALTEDDRLLLEGLCGQIAIAIRSAELVETIRQNEARLAEALRTARLANWEYDVEKDIFTFNDQFYSIFHSTAEKAGGYQLSSARYAELFVHPDDMGLVGSEIGKSLSSTERVYNTTLDHRIVYEDGGIGYITVKVTVERDEAGKVIRYYGANQDITERKQAEARLAEALKIARLANWEYDVEKDIFTFNDQFYSIFHSTAEKAGGYQLSSARYAELFVHPDDMGLVGSEIGKSLSSTERVYNTTLDHRIVYEDGGIGYITVKVTVERDEAGKVIRYYGANQDITERKQAEEALRRSEQLMRTVIDSTPDWIFIKDQEHRYQLANKGYADALHIAPGDFIGKNDLDLGFPEELVKGNPEKGIRGFWTDDRLVMDSNETQVYPDDPATIDGMVHNFHTIKVPLRDADGKAWGVLAFARDITERKQAEEALASERRLLRVLMSTMLDLVYVKDAEHRFLLASDTVVRSLGAETSDEVVGKTDFDFHPRELAEQYFADEKSLMESGLPLIDHEESAMDHATGTFRWLSSTKAPLQDSQGNVIGLVGLNRDITERKQAEDALRRNEQEMAERLEEINRLYRAMSHEGWKTYRETADLPTGFMFDQTGAKPLEENILDNENFTSIPMKVLGGETVGNLAVANDPRNPTSLEDLDFLQQVSDQVALALEGARLAAQTQSALAQTEKLSEAGLLFTRATDLQEVVRIAVETLDISKINRAALETFNYNSENEVESMHVLANWWNGTGHKTTDVGTRYTPEVLPLIQLFLTPTPVFIEDAFQDERVDSVSAQIVRFLNIHAVAVLPLFLADKQIGVLLLESEEIHEFNQDEIRLFSAMGPQISTVLENRRQYERAQQQAERESTLNIISQKIQSATTVEAVLQIAARELGHALGAPMTIAQLSMKDRK